MVSGKNISTLFLGHLFLLSYSMTFFFLINYLVPDLVRLSFPSSRVYYLDRKLGSSLLEVEHSNVPSVHYSLGHFVKLSTLNGGVTELKGSLSTTRLPVLTHSTLRYPSNLSPWRYRQGLSLNWTCPTLLSVRGGHQCRTSKQWRLREHRCGQRDRNISLGPKVHLIQPICLKSLHSTRRITMLSS